MTSAPTFDELLQGSSAKFVCNWPVATKIRIRLYVGD